MIEGKVWAFNFFDDDLEYQLQHLDAHVYMRFYLSSLGFAKLHSLALL